MSSVQHDNLLEEEVMHDHEIGDVSGALSQTAADALYSPLDTLTPTPVTVKGGVVRVIDSATGDIAVTTNGWIEDEKYNSYFNITAPGTGSAEFDTAVLYNGKKTIKISMATGTGEIQVRLLGGTSFPSGSLRSNLIPIKPSTSYIFKVRVKTSVVSATDGIYGRAITCTSTGTNLIVNKTTTITTTNGDFTEYTVTFTSGATAVFADIVYQLSNCVADTWWDPICNFEEVSSLSNPSSLPALLYPKGTAVKSTDNIDQSQVTGGTGNSFGDNTGTHFATAVRFTPTKKNLTGITYQKLASTGTNIGDVTVSIKADSAGIPSGADLTSVTISAATWNALANSTDNTSLLPLTLTPGTQYWIVWSCSTQDASNHPNVNSAAAVTGRSNYNGTTWGAVTTNAAYFKTLYSKNTTNFTVSTDTQTVSVTAPTTDGWADGTVIDTSDGTYGITPLTLAAGVNNIYYSSNGPATADGTVDPSLQGIISGKLYYNNYAALDKANIFTALNTFPSIVETTPTLLKLDQTTPQTVTGTLTLPSLTVDTNTLFVDSANNRVGIGTTGPGYGLDVFGTTAIQGIRSAMGFDINPVIKPTFAAGNLALAAGGSNLGIGAYIYTVTYTTALGETNTSAGGSITTNAGNRQVTITLPISTDIRVTGRKIYRTNVGGAVFATKVLIAIANNTDATYLDDIADVSLTGSTAYFRSNTTSSALSINGSKVFYVTQSLNANTFFGYSVGNSTLTSGRNVAFGGGIMTSLTSGGHNVGVGNAVLQLVTSGVANVGMGYGTMNQLTTGSNNISIGFDSLFYNSTGGNNTVLGYFAMFGVSGNSCDNNVAIGSNAGRTLSTGSTNTFLGYNAGNHASQLVTVTNSMALGANTYTVAGNQVVLGNTTQNISLGHFTTPNSRCTLPAGTATAGTAPLSYQSGTLLTVAVAGVNEFLTDDFYGTITTGAARKKFVLDDGTNLVAGDVPYVTTNGRLKSQTPVANGTYTMGLKLTGGGVDGTITITNGIISAIQQAT